MASKTQDPELKKAFAELQSQLNETNNKIRISDVQCDGIRKQMAHSQLTDKEIQQLGSDVRVFESVGRMFMLTDIPSIRKGLAEKIESGAEKIKRLQSNKEKLEKSLGESQNNLREMVKLRQQAVE